MKKIIFLLAIACGFVDFSFSQAPPQGINYQAVIYDDQGFQNPGIDLQGQVLKNQVIRVRFTIIQNTVSGEQVYKEQHETTTDDFGLISLVIGFGTPISTSGFDQIDWGSDAHFLKVEIDKNKSNNYINLGTQQLLSVPYALYGNYSNLAGNGIESIQDNGNGSLTINFQNGNSFITPVFTGPQGPQGEQGLQGATGATGPQGPQGIQGEQGIQGQTGATGPQGLTGPMGPIGPQGPQGEVGATGPQGATGATGSPGLTGPMGPMGPQGLQGIQGEVGPQGPQGEAGTGVTILGSFNNESELPLTGNPGDSYLINGDLYVWDQQNNIYVNVGNIQGPAGPQGIQGVAGPVGPAGPQGLTGPMGPIGPQGLQGEVGPQGPAGAQGPAGPQGEAGPIGPAGPAGPDAQTLSIVGTTLTISNGNSVTLPAGGSGGTLDNAYNFGGAGNGRTINANSGSVQIINGGTVGLEVNSAIPNSSAILTNVTNTGVGVRVESTNASNTFSAIQATTNSSTTTNSAIIGNNSGAGYGVAGQIPGSATGAYAVFGNNLRTNGGAGVAGIGANGVVGFATNGDGFGIFGSNDALTGNAIGVYGIGFNGVYGQTTDVTNGWAGYFTADIGVEGAGFALGGWINASDRRLKSEIKPITSAVSKINLLQGTHYQLNTKFKKEDGTIGTKSRFQYGLIAQDLETVFPEMVQEKALFKNLGDETLYKTVDYIQLVPVLIEAVKELNEEIEKLKLQLEELKK